ncbi:Aamy domain-containing protein [Meloidogyne graminicola]|uniref:Aamy domain-containing protein n=1 Tax=Meloidogyne graminicola TaxID=189291 RepID=A0A8S9ZYG0_9BILA|nr:Aamy domain-containing protein [Meloidogyne graminicola]
MPPIPDGPLEDVKRENDLESAKFTKDKETVDVIQPTAKLIGLTKEQLEQYRNDPFWKTIRYTLFIVFWLIWLAMFIGAILIVVLSPKCVDVEWQNKMTVYKIFSLAYKDADNTLDSNAGFGDFAGIMEKLGEIKQMGISVIWPTPILNYDKNKLSPEAVLDLEISTELGGQEAFKELIKAAHTKDLKVLVDLPLTVAPGNGNWVKLKGIKNGILTSTNDASLLNLKNPEIQEPLLALARKFVNLGVDALNLADYGLLGQNDEDLILFANKINSDPKLKNMLIYLFLRILNVGGNINSINPLFGKGESKGLNALLTKLNGNIDSIKSKNNTNNNVINEQLIKPNIWNIGNLNIKGYRIDQLLTDISLPDQRKAISHLFSLVELFIPGPVVVLYGEELGALSGKFGNKNPSQIVYPWDNSSIYTKDNQFFAVPQIVKNGDYESQIKDEYSPLKVFSKLAKLRQQSDFILGELVHNSLNNLDLYLLNRYPFGSFGHYALLINWNKTENNILIKEFLNKINSKKVNILTSTEKTLWEETQKLFDNYVDEMAEQKIVFPAFSAMIIKSE